MANDFTDPRCKALWRFENGALTADSKGTNTLTAHNTPAADTGDFKEGAASVVLTSAANKYFSIADASIDAGFPLKSDDATKKVTFCFWHKVSANSSWRNIFGKWVATSHKMSLLVADDNGTLRVELGYNTGASAQEIVPGLTIATNRWYHIAIVIDGIAKTIFVRVWDDTAGAVILDYSGTFTNALWVGDCDFNIGFDGDYTTTSPDGQYDEFVVFNDLLAAAETDKIRAGTYGAPYEYAPAGIPLTLTPDSTYESPPIIPPDYVGHALLRLTPIATTSLFDPGAPDAIPASTGGWAMGGAGVWASSTPTDTGIPVPDDLSGYYLGGGAAAGEAEVISTIPGADEIVTEGAPFLFCGTGATGNATTSKPAQDVIEDEVAFKFGGAGVWGQVAPADLPGAVLVSTGGFVLSGSGFSLDPGFTPTSSVLVPTGGYKMEGRRPDPVEVTYPDNLDRVISETAAFEMGGNEGSWESSVPPSTVIPPSAAAFALTGAGLCTSKMPPSMLIVIGEGGYVLAGATPAEVFEAWVLSGQAFEPSVWSAFNFNSFAVKGGQAYAAGDAGIYLLGADHDAGETIHTGARIGPVNFGSDRDKRFRGIQFGQGGKNTRVRVRSDEGKVGVFETDRDENRVVVSRDIQGREFTIDILDFEELSQCEIMPLRLARR